MCDYICRYVWSMSEKKSWGLKCLIPFKGQYNKNGKGTIYADPLSVAPLPQYPQILMLL